MFDDKCLDLAEHFVPHLSAPRLAELAQHIQDSIEDWIETTRDQIAADLARSKAS